MRCDVIAEGIIAACKELNMNVPIVCRLQVTFLSISSNLFYCACFPVLDVTLFGFQGTEVDTAKVLIASAGLKILPTDDLDEAARLAVKLSNIVGMARSANLNINFEIPL